MSNSTPDTTAPSMAPALAGEKPSAAPWKSTLLAGEVACGFCGIAVSSPPPSSIFPLTPMGINRGGRMIEYRGDDLTFATCASCSARHQEAARIIGAHPSIRARFGTDNAQHRLSAALDACAALGKSAPSNLDKNGDLVVNIMRMLLAPGNGSRWFCLFAPFVTGEAGTGSCASEPWAHVTAECQTELRSGYARVLAFRVAQSQPDQAVACPSRGGCMLCGVRAVTLPATRVAVLGGSNAAASFIWSERSATSSTLGGRGVRDRLDGHLCPTCDQAVQDAGSFGMAAMGRSLAEHLRGTDRDGEAKNIAAAARRDDLEGMVAHAVLGGRGTRTPWEHVSLAG